MPLKFQTSDRHYQEWSIVDTLTMQKTECSVDPIREKLFNQDIFSLNEKCTILHSMVRQMKCIQGVLVLENNKTYGKWNRDKFLYQCIPDDRRLPVFLIPYKLKLSFGKKVLNKYITFSYKNWDNKHPYGTILQIIGNVDNLSSFYEYQLYCKSLYASIQQFNKATMTALRKKSSDSYIQTIAETYQLNDRSDWNVYSIDPPGSKDYDDAWSIRKEGDKMLLSIYIANVSFWLDILNLWDSFSERISTIYLPDRKRPMLPTILSDALCSLQERNKRFAFTLDVLFDPKTGVIQDTTYSNTCVKLKRNFRYETEELKQCEDYQRLFKYVKILNKQYPYQRKIKDSHDVIAYMMILMNYISGKKMLAFKAGIFRSVQLKESIHIPEKVPTNISRFIKTWNSSGGKYVTFDKYHSHDLLQLDAYIHITSPIRRLPDLLNIIKIQILIGLLPSATPMEQFYEAWLHRLPYINKTMRSIRKVQNDCTLLHYCVSKRENENEKGYIFDKIVRNDGLFQYMVYFPAIKMVNRFTTRHDYENYSRHEFRIFVFMDEDRLKQKLRIDLI